MDKLVDNSGRPNYGWIKEAVGEVNYLDFPLANTMDKPLSTGVKQRKFNQFHFIGVLADNFMAGLAIVDLKLISNCFFLCMDTRVRLGDRKKRDQSFGTRHSLIK